MHVDEFIFNCCVSSMVSDDISDPPEECAMNVFSIDENKIRDANGIIFAEAITCYKCTFCGKMFAAMEVVLTHYQSNHRCSVIPLLKGSNYSKIQFLNNSKLFFDSNLKVCLNRRLFLKFKKANLQNLFAKADKLKLQHLFKRKPSFL